MPISGFRAINLGDGVSVELNWSVVDITQVKYFIIERYDRHIRSWVSFDNFHGIVEAQIPESFEDPSQRLNVTLEELDSGQQVFRVKAVMNDGSSSDWTTSTVDVKTIKDTETTTGTYYILAGLDVVRKEDSLVVKPGTAMLGGTKAVIKEDFVLDGLEDNNKYIVYIDSDGIIDLAQIDKTKTFQEVKTTDYSVKSLRLANIIVNADGSVVIDDTRFLWPPHNIAVSSTSRNGVLYNNISWEDIFELNASRYKIYRAVGEAPADADYRLIGTVESTTKDFKNKVAFPEEPQLLEFQDDDDKVLSYGQSFCYRVSVVDYDENESQRSAPIRSSFETIEKIDTPQGLSVTTGGFPSKSLATLYNKLSWRANTESDLLGYRIYIYQKSYEEWELLTTVPKEATEYIHSGLYNGSEYTYAITAYSPWFESEKSESISIITGDLVAPASPTWDFSDPIETGGTSSTAWVKLKWNPVKENIDGTAITDLSGYKIYLVSEENGQTIFLEEARTLEDKTETTIEYLASERGKTKRYVISAYDLFGNESGKSIEKSIVLGGEKPNTPLFTLKNLNSDGKDKVAVTIKRGTASNIKEYKIYKALESPSATNEVHTLVDELEGSIDEITWVDTKVERGKTYSYAVVAINDQGYPSDKALEKTIEVGDFNAPEAPTINSYGSTVEEADDGSPIIKNWIKFELPKNTETGKLKDLDLRGVYVYRGLTKDHLHEIGYLYRAEENFNTEYEFYHTDNITNGKIYYYALVAEDYSGNKSEIDPLQIISIASGNTTRPTAPLGFTAEGVLDLSGETPVAGIKLSWSLVDGVKGYRLYKSSTGKPHTYTLIQDITSQDISDQGIPSDGTCEFTDSNLTNGASYWYCITSYNNLNIESEKAYENTKAGDIQGPDAPSVSSSLTYNDDLSVDISLSWSVVADDVVKYEILKAEESSTIFKTIGFTTETSFIDTINYPRSAKYKVVGYDLVGNRGEESVVTEVKTIRNSNPAGVIIDSIEQYQFDGLSFDAKLAWTPQDESLEFFKSFNIYIKKEGSTTETVLQTISDASCREWTIKKLPKDVTYYIGVYIIDIFNNESVHTDEEFTPEDLEAPDPVTGLVGEELELGIRLQWNPSEAIDLAGYKIEACDDGSSLDDPLAWNLVATTTANHFLHNLPKPTTKYYRVRAYDNSGNISDSGAFVGPLTSKFIGRSAFDQVPPSNVTGLKAESSGIDASKENQTANAYIVLSWDENSDVDFDHYNIYVNDQYYGQTKQTRYKLNGLLSGTSYRIKITATDEYNNESPLPEALEIIEKTDGYAAVIPKPIPKEVIQSIRNLFVKWDPPEFEDGTDFPHVSEYEIQYVENDGSLPAEEDWITLTRSKFTYFSHGRLTYGKKYHYRVKTISTLGKDSEWAVFPGVHEPVKAAHEDVSHGTVTSDLLQTRAVLASHIASKAITFEKLDGNSVYAHHIVSKAINANHLNISIGNRNLVQNSAFGMVDRASGLYGINWYILDGGIQYNLQDYIEKHKKDEEPFSTIINNETDIDIPISDYALRLYSVPAKTAEIFQPITIPKDTDKLVLTIRVNATNIYTDGQDCGVIIDLYDYDAVTPGPILDNKGNQQRLTIVNSTYGWEQETITFQIPEDYISAALRIRFNNTHGDFRITAIKIEEGDVATKWTPAPGETYLATGSVQVNSTGIIVSNGEIRIEADKNETSHVLINDKGIFAGKKDFSQYARMDSGGFTSVGGMFQVTTAGSFSETQNSLVIKGDGIFAYGGDTSPDAKPTVEISSNGNFISRNGSFTLTTNEDVSNRLVLDSSGIDLKESGNTVFKVDAKNNRTEIGHSFVISSAASGSARFEINQSELKAYNGKGNVTFMVKGSDGTVSIGKGLVVSSSGFDNLGNVLTGGPRIEIKTTGFGSGIYGYKEDNTLGYKLLNDGTAEFHNGSITITSKSETESNQIKVDGHGIIGPNFSLTDGSNGESAALVITNASISQGAVTLNETGITVNGTDGIKVNNENGNTIVNIDQDGVKVQRGGGIKIIEDPNDANACGSITYGTDNKVAIDKSGITANSITTGTLFVNGSEDNADPKIIVGNEVNPTIKIDSSGINVYNGSINVSAEDGSTLIENGMISANALNIVGGSSNLLRNGRGDYSDETGSPKYWNIDGATVKVVQEISESINKDQAGISGKNAIKIKTTLADQGISQTPCKDYENPTSMIRKDRVYTAVWNIYVQSGSVEVCMKNTKNLEGNESSPIVLGAASTEYGVNEWHRIYQRFKVDSDTNTATFSITSHGGSAIVYATDLMVVEGEFASSYGGHISELNASGRVSISDGSIEINLCENKLKLNDSGLSFTGQNQDTEEEVSFSLNQDGFKFNVGRQGEAEKFEISGANGILAGDVNNKYVKIDKEGIVSNGSFKLEGGDEDSGFLSITPSKIKVTGPSSNKSIAISPNEGIHVIGPGAITIESAVNLDINESKMIIKPEYISMKTNIGTQSLPKYKTSLHIGNMQSIKDEFGDEPPSFNHGIYIADGNFLLKASNFAESSVENDQSKTQEDLSLSKDGLFLTRKSTDENGNETTHKCIINAEGIRFEVNGSNDYRVNNIVFSKTPVPANGQNISFGKTFSSCPEVIIIPAQIQLYDPNEKYKNQNIRFYVADVTETSFRAFAKIKTSNSSGESTALEVKDSDGNWQESSLITAKKMAHKETWIARTASNAEQLSIKINWTARKFVVGDYQDFVKFRVSFSYDEGNSWVDGPIIRKEGGGLFGKDNIGSMVVDSNVTDGSKRILVKVWANINNGYTTEDNDVSISAVKYMATPSVDVSSAECAYINWIAMGD